MRFSPPFPVNTSPAHRGSAAANCAMVCLLLWPAACTKPAAPPSDVPASTPLPRAAEALPETPPTAITPPPAPALPSEAPARPDNVADLDTRYHAHATSPEDRDEIIQTLGRLDAPQAVTVLRRIFEEEKRLELRMRVLEVAADLPAQIGALGRWELFARATEARQPVVIRLSGMQTLAESEDPRLVPLLQQLARDPDASIRETAARILKEHAP